MSVEGCRMVGGYAVQLRSDQRSTVDDNSSFPQDILYAVLVKNKNEGQKSFNIFGGKIVR